MSPRPAGENCPRFDEREVRWTRAAVEKALGLPDGSIDSSSRRADIVRGRVIVDYILNERHPGYLYRGHSLQGANQRRRRNISIMLSCISNPNIDPELYSDYLIVDNYLCRENMAVIFAVIWD